MSRRVPESLGSRLVARTVSGLPDPSVLDSIPQDAPPTSREVLTAFLSSRDAGKWPIDISIAARWRRCRQVYDFDRRLSEALARTPAEDVPAEAIRLPYPIQYVSAALGIVPVLSFCHRLYPVLPRLSATGLFCRIRQP